MMHGLDEIAAVPALAADLTPAEALEQLGKIAAVQIAILPHAFQSEPDKSSEPDRLLNASELAEKLGLKESWVRSASRSGDIPCQRIGRYVRFDLGDVRAALSRKNVKGI
jgi:predicted DNA-binding transcriptional regulator AlpA